MTKITACSYIEADQSYWFVATNTSNKLFLYLELLFSKKLFEVQWNLLLAYYLLAYWLSIKIAKTITGANTISDWYCLLKELV